MSASKLVRPDIRYKDSFLEGLNEYHSEGRQTYRSMEYIRENFEEFISDLREEKGIPHKPRQEWVELVPETVLWLVKDDLYIGTVLIRHRLNWHLEKWGGHVNFFIRPSMRGKGFGKKLLRKAMPYINHFGIEKALITISPDAKRAAHIIEQLGGEYWDTTHETDCFPVQKRYWLDCQ